MGAVGEPRAHRNQVQRIPAVDEQLHGLAQSQLQPIAAEGAAGLLPKDPAEMKARDLQGICEIAEGKAFIQPVRDQGSRGFRQIAMSSAGCSA